MPTRTRGIDRQLHFEPSPSLKRACCQRQVACCTLFRALYVNACMAAHHRPVHHRPVRACVRKKAPPQPVSRSAACWARPNDPLPPQPNPQPGGVDHRRTLHASSDFGSTEKRVRFAKWFKDIDSGVSCSCHPRSKIYTLHRSCCF